MVKRLKRIGESATSQKSGGLASSGIGSLLFWLALGVVVTGCANLSEPAAFNPNQTGFASCQFAAEAHPAPFNRDDITYGESVRSRTGMTEAMRECFARLDRIRDNFGRAKLSGAQ